MGGNKRKISNVEWALVIAALGAIDLIQIGLDFLAVGLFGINTCIDITTGASLGLYLHLNGQSLANPKRLMGWLGTLGLDGLGDGTLPLWCLDGIYNFALAKAEEKTEGTAVGTLVSKGSNNAAQMKPSAGITRSQTAQNYRPVNENVNRAPVRNITEQPRKKPTTSRETENVGRVRENPGGRDWMRDRSVDEVKQNEDPYLYKRNNGNESSEDTSQAA